MIPGTTRSMVTLDDGKTGLKISYGSGGITPGDSYVWLYDENYLPYEWRMWVKIIPVGGTPSSLTGWQKMNSGTLISTRHSLGGKEMDLLTEVQDGESLPAIDEDEELFSPLTGG